jgi:hypothetical protein
MWIDDVSYMICGQIIDTSTVSLEEPERRAIWLSPVITHPSTLISCLSRS